MQAAATSSRNTTVLIVEDELLIRMLAADALEEAGFAVLQAAHAAEALETLIDQARSIAVLFTDVHMPGPTNGVHLAHRARGSWPWIHLIVASGQLLPGPHELPEGSHFVPKPYDLSHVVNHILAATAPGQANGLPHAP